MAQTLSAGTHDSIDDGTLTAFIGAAMREEWLLARGEVLPDDGPGAQDRRILFAAVAKGVLRYLYEHRGDLVTTLEHLEGLGPDHRHDAAFDLLEKT